MLEPLDRQELLAGVEPKPAAAFDDLDDDALLTKLGVDATKDDMAELRHVRSAADKRAAEEIANRTKCEDFDKFKPLFEKVQREIETGIRQIRLFELKAEIRPGSWFIVGGQKAYVAEMGEMFSNAQGRTDGRDVSVAFYANAAARARCNGGAIAQERASGGSSGQRSLQAFNWNGG
jgi:hypothetical protein